MLHHRALEQDHRHNYDEERAFIEGLRQHLREAAHRAPPKHAICASNRSPVEVRVVRLIDPLPADIHASSRRLQVYRIGRVLFDLAPQPIDEDVDRSLLDRRHSVRTALREKRIAPGGTLSQRSVLAARWLMQVNIPARRSAWRECKASEANDTGLEVARRRGSGASKHRADPRRADAGAQMALRDRRRRRFRGHALDPAVRRGPST